MGQCMSRKAAGAFAASAAVSQNRPTEMHKRQLQSPSEDRFAVKPRPPNSNRRPPTRGVATSFGFKRRPASLTDADADSLTGNAAPSGRSTPKLVPPKKEAAAATRVSRFGFRNAQGTRQNKVADLNGPVDVNQNRNSNIIKKPTPVNRNAFPSDNNNTRIGMMNTDPQSQIGRFTLQSTHLPRPEPIRLIETKTAKTLANNNRRVAGMYQQQTTTEDNSSKDGSLTEDSGLGSHLSGCPGNEADDVDRSPTFGARRRRTLAHKPRGLEVVVSSAKKTFDLRDAAYDSNDSCDSVGAPPLPRLPSAFVSDNRNSSYQSLGLVRERTLEYQGHIDRNNRQRKISKTSSEGFSDDYGDEEKTYRDKFASEKSFLKPTMPHSTFLKSRTSQLKGDSSPPSSDEHEWGHGGEAMADDVSFSFSSSDESKDKQAEEGDRLPASAAVVGTALQSLMSQSLAKAFVSNDVRNVMLNIEDSKFAAVAAASNTVSLLDDETLLSPSDSVTSFSESGEKKKMRRSSSNSKEVNERQSSSPGTPTNASNSLSISDGKDDFLIDDEIADQPSLVFEDTPTLPNENSTETMIGSTPISKRKVPLAFYGSPISARSKKFSQNRTGSLDTLSPCESIASDDLMMDFCVSVSQSSGLEECDGQSSGYPSLNETIVKKNDASDSCRTFKDWEVHSSLEKQKKSTPSRTRLLSSRTSTPLDSPKSPDSRPSRLSRLRDTTSAQAGYDSGLPGSPSRLSRLRDVTSAQAGYDSGLPGSPSRLSRLRDGSSAGYESDDSVRLDKASHAAVKQDIVGIKTMLLKLRRVLNETAEEDLMRSDTHNPFDSHHLLTNGIFNADPDDCDSSSAEDNVAQARLELAELGRQVLFLQGQLEDRERTVRSLQERVGGAKENVTSREDGGDRGSCNAATQTERIRPISAGPSLLNGSPVDGSAGSLVSASEPSLQHRRSRLPTQTEASKPAPQRLWRQPGEPASPQRYAPNPSAIPRRALSRSRTPASIS